MARKKTSYAFTKASLTMESGRYILTEYSKDSSESFDLSSILENYLDVEGIALSIASEDCVPAIEEE